MLRYMFVLAWLFFCLHDCNGSTRSGSRGSAVTEENRSNHITGLDLSPLSEECELSWSCCDSDAHHNCQDILPQGIVKCCNNTILSALSSYCVTIDKENSILEAGLCLYNYNIHGLEFPRNRSELNGVMCGSLHRTGTLCGKCQDGYYPLAYSFDMKCVPCPNGKSNWWKFLLAAFLPLTVFYAIVLFFKVNVAASRFQGFLFYSQMISWPAMVRVLHTNHFRIESQARVALTATKYVTTLYGIWNLDFFRSMNLGICLGTDSLQTLSLDLLVGVYPLLLMLMSYVLIELYDRNFKPLVVIWKPFRTLFGLFRENWEIRTSLIDAFATMILLTNVKFQSVSFDLLTPVKVYHLNNTGQWTYSFRLFYDATIPYFGPRHLPYAIMGLAVLLLSAILPVLLLILYPCSCFQKLLNLFPARWYILHTFVDSFYGCYKDGTQPGTRDCRWFASLFIISRFSLMLVGAYTQSAMYFPIASMVLTLVAIFTVAVQPFKKDHFADISVLLFVFLLGLLYVSCVGLGVSRNGNQITAFFAVAILTAILPLVYISAIILAALDVQQREVWNWFDKKVTRQE